MRFSEAYQAKTLIRLNIGPLIINLLYKAGGLVNLHVPLIH